MALKKGYYPYMLQPKIYITNFLSMKNKLQ